MPGAHAEDRRNILFVTDLIPAPDSRRWCSNWKIPKLSLSALARRPTGRPSVMDPTPAEAKFRRPRSASIERKSQ